MKTKTLSPVGLILAIFSISGSDLFAVIRSPYPQRATPPDLIQTASALQDALSCKNWLLNGKSCHCLTNHNRVAFVNTNRLAIPTAQGCRGHPLND